MPDKNVRKSISSRRRQKRVRKKIRGAAQHPRLTVYRSLRQIYAQLIDDESGVTLFGASSLTPQIRKQVQNGDSKVEISRKVGLHLAQMAKEKSIDKVVFDRNRYRYQGRVKSLAQGAREGGLKF